MAKKPAKKASSAKAKKSGKVRDLPAKSLGAKKAAAVKGGAIGFSAVKDDWEVTKALKVGSQLKVNTTGFIK